jgi:hypothetical protein
VIDGAAGVSPGAETIEVHADMTAAQVAAVVQQTLADHFGGGVASSFPVDGERIQVVAHDVDDPGPLGLADELPGDIFGSFFASTLFDGSTDANNPGALRARANDFEGVYVDDLIIGFAERGEMATASVANTGFINNAVAPSNQILVGDYQVEIRRSGEYGIAIPPPVPTLLLLNSIDTNDRVSQQHTLVAPAAADVVDGQTFTLSDGVNSVVFEFEDVNIGNGVVQGHFAIPFDATAPDASGGVSAESSVVIARRIRDAINSTAVQAV